MASDSAEGASRREVTVAAVLASLSLGAFMQPFLPLSMSNNQKVLSIISLEIHSYVQILVIGVSDNANEEVTPSVLEAQGERILLFFAVVAPLRFWKDLVCSDNSGLR